MNIVQLTPGAGAMYCGNCLRDNALVRSMRAMGHQVLMVPLYLPLTLDEVDESAGTPIFFGGVSVYLAQKSALFRSAPEWLHDLLSSPKVLKWASGKTAKTRAADVGDLTLSMLKGDEGNQAREADKLIAFLRTQPKPDVICLSNLLLTGLVRRLQTDLNAAVVCLMQGEDSFLDALPADYRDACWEKVAENAARSELLIATSKYYADSMRQRLGLAPEQVSVVHSGISLDGYPDSPNPNCTGRPATIGFFARMCRDKGLDTLVEAFLYLRRSGRHEGLKLKVGGSCGPSDEPLVAFLKQQLESAGLLKDVSFHPNLTREQKIEFLRSLSVFSVPARYGEAFGLYLVEAMGAGVPVVQPRAAAFPELIENTRGGLLCEPENPVSLADTIEQLLENPKLAAGFGESGAKAVRQRFCAEAAARATLQALETAQTRSLASGQAA